MILLPARLPARLLSRAPRACTALVRRVRPVCCVLITSLYSLLAAALHHSCRSQSTSCASQSVIRVVPWPESWEHSLTTHSLIVAEGVRGEGAHPAPPPLERLRRARARFKVPLRRALPHRLATLPKTERIAACRGGGGGGGAIPPARAARPPLRRRIMRPKDFGVELDPPDGF